MFAPIMSARDNKTQIELPLILNGLFFLHCVLFFMYELKNELITDRHFKVTIRLLDKTTAPF